MTSATETDLKTLAAEVATLRGDVERVMATLGDLARHGTGDAKAAVHDSLASAREEFERGKQRLIAKIEEEPVTAALTALAIGLLFGMGCGRR